MAFLGIFEKAKSLQRQKICKSHLLCWLLFFACKKLWL